MKSNFHSNQILYVKGIGYARLAIDKQKDPKSNDTSNQAQNSNSNLPAQQENDEMTDAVLFDPDMFRIDSDSPFGDSQVQINLSEHNTRKKSVEMLRRQSTDIKNRQLIIVPLKLQQTNAMIYCPDTYLMKKIVINVKSLLHNCRKEIQIPIQITKTIDNFKNLIFKELGQDISIYSDVRIFTSTPRLQELNIGSKTIWQCQLKDKCKITLMARFNFTFKPLPQGFEEHYALSNGNNTIATVVKKPEVATETTTNVPIQPVTTTPTTTEQTKSSQQKVTTSAQSLPQVPPQQVQKPVQTQQRQKISQKQKKLTQPQKLHLQCIFFDISGNAKLRSGIHYWEVKIDKLSINKQQISLLIGICLKNQESALSQDFVHLWAFDPIRCKKIQHSEQKKHKMVQKDDKQNNGSDQSDEQYGSFVKNGDVVGVLLIIKQKRATLIFYKNSTCLSQCYEFSAQILRDKATKSTNYLCPFIEAKGQIQLTIDSKAVAPLDSYRFK